MKKLKIFLLLSILLCLGFILSSEVHAQSNEPKAFEIGDILPANAQIRISWTQSLGWGTPQDLTSSYINGSGVSDSLEIFIDLDDGPIIDFHIYTAYNDYYIVESYGNFNPPYTDYGDGHAYCDIVLISPVTITNVDYNMDLFTWEVLNTLPKPFEVGDVLPAGYIKISWDFTDKFTDIFDEYVTFNIYADGDPENTLYIQIEVDEYGEEVNFYINYEEFQTDTPGETVIILPIPYTINQIDVYGDYDYYVSVGDALLWEVVTEEDFNYSEGYQDGYSDGYYLGYEHARGLYGYYDSTTDEWLTVSEYLDRYGTDKMGQSDFYGNFDKYFIPAMIIVFGGAIVLTILKVFKGRE